MGRTCDPTPLPEALRVMSAALEAHRDESPWREIITQTRRCRGSLTFGVGVYDEASARVVDHYEIRVLGSFIEVVDHGHLERPVDWRVSIDELRRIGADLEAADALGLAWLEMRLGLAPNGA